MPFLSALLVAFRVSLARGGIGEFATILRRERELEQGFRSRQSHYAAFGSRARTQAMKGSVQALPNQRLTLPAHVECGMKRSPGRRSLGAPRKAACANSHDAS
jgi:hypothetical protein